MGEPAYNIEYAHEAVSDIKALRAWDRKTVVKAIEQHLTNAPTREGGSRIKPMRQPFWSQFRLRVGDFRDYYDTDDARRVVHVLRVVKKGQGQTPGSPP